jgi:RepB DNA-primase from phage plasmid
MKNEEVVIEFLAKFGTQSLIVPLKEKNKSQTDLPVPTKTLASKNVYKNYSQMNDPGDYAIYFLVNESKSPTKRTKTDITRCRAVWIEDDVTGCERDDFPIPPNIVVNSSPNKFHYYWLTDTTDTEQHQLVMQTMVDSWNCDPNARDISRVMRIPGFYHIKKEKFLVTVKYPVSHPYVWETVVDAFPPADKVVKPGHTSEGKFDRDHAAGQIASGDNYHDQLRSLALRYANKHLDRDEIATMLRGYMESCPKDKRDKRWQDRNSDQHIYECVDSALKKVSGEQTGEEIETAQIENAVVITRVDKLPLDVLAPDNCFGDLVKAIHDSWWKPNWMSAHLAAKSLVAYLAGGNYRGTDGTRVNIQQVGVGRTGCGKDPISNAPNKIISALFSTTPYKEIGNKIVHDIASAEGLEDVLRAGDKHDVLFCADEIGGFIEQAQRPGPKQGVLNALLTFYSKSDEMVSARIRSKGSASQQAAKPQGSVELHTMMSAPHAIVSGATTPNLVVEGLGMSFIQRGNAARMLFFDCDSYMERAVVDKLDLTEELVGERAAKKLLEIISTLPAAPGTAGSILGSMPTARVFKPLTVDFSAVKTMAYDFGEFADSKIGNGGGITEIWNRASVNAKKHAMIEALMCDGIVTEEIMERAIKFVTSGCEYTVKLFKNEVGENETDLAKQKVVQLLRNNKGKKVQLKAIHNQAWMRKLRASERKQLLAEMEEEGSIEKLEIKNPHGKPTIFYIEAKII